MVDEAGGEYHSHTINPDYWGGTMLVAFTKRSHGARRVSPLTTERPTELLIRRSYAAFRRQLDDLAMAMDTLAPPRLCGYGAAQMVPTLAYHMDSDLSCLECIWDDNADRAGLMYPHLPVPIRRPPADLVLDGAAVLVTALDSVRPILARLAALRPRHILVPLHTF
jgi:hypothetical protein